MEARATCLPFVSRQKNTRRAGIPERAFTATYGSTSLARCMWLNGEPTSQRRKFRTAWQQCLSKRKSATSSPPKLRFLFGQRWLTRQANKSQTLKTWLSRTGGTLTIRISTRSSLRCSKESELWTDTRPNSGFAPLPSTEKRDLYSMARLGSFTVFACTMISAPWARRLTVAQRSGNCRL